MSLCSTPFKKAIISFGLLSVFALGFYPNTPALAGDSEAPCTAKTDWFPHETTPEPNNEQFASTSNCNFHLWSWQMFLWLTQPHGDDQQPRFLSFKSPEALLGNEENSTLTLGLMPRTSKSNHVRTLDEIDQAGSDAILVDQNGRAIYYSQHINQKFVDFVQEHGLNNPEAVRKFPADKSFDIGVIELKASWKIVAEGENTDDFFTMTDNVYKLTNKGGKIHIDRTKTENVTLALVGFHIGGVVNGHPEMIWVTFEHNKNAPNVYLSSRPKKAPPIKPTDSISEDDFTFYKANTPYSECNVNTVGRQTLDEATQKLSPVTQVCRQYQYGNEPHPPSPSPLNSKESSIAKNDKNINKYSIREHAY